MMDILAPDNPVKPTTDRRTLANALAHAGRRCRQQGQVRPPRHADGHGRYRRGAVEPPPAPQPRRPALARPRPLRAVQRPWIDAALRAASPDRLRPAAGGAEELPPASLPHPRPSGMGHHAGRGDDDRAARPGHLQRRRHGAGRTPAGRRVQPARAYGRRSPHLRLRRRRLPDGGHLPRGLLAGRDAGAGKAGGVLRRQRHLDRRPCPGLVHRRYAEALRSLWLAGDPRRGRPRRGGTGRRHRRGADAVGQADAGLLQDGDRLGRSEDGGDA